MRRAAAKSRELREIIAGKGFELNESKCVHVGAAIGTGVHAGAAYVMNDKKITGEPCRAKDMADVGIEKFHKEMVGGIEFDGTSQNANNSDLQIQSISKMFCFAVAPKINPVEVEKALPAKVTVDFGIMGHADVIADEGIIDTKTGVRLHSYHANMGGYRIVARSNDIPKETLKNLIINWIPRTRINSKRVLAQKPPQTICYNPLECEDEAYSQLYMIIEQVMKFVQSGDPASFPRNPMSMMCSEKWCPAWGTEFCKMTK